MSHELTDRIANLPPGEHLCLFYEKDPLEQLPALVPYLKAGLGNNEQCIYVVDDQTVEELAHQLIKNGIDVRTEIDRGALRFLSRHEWRQPGELSSANKATQVQGFIRQALGSGFAGVRFSVEMTWALGPDIGAKQMEHWEATLNTLFTRDVPGRIVCQYNRHRIDPQVVLAALYTHPLLILGCEIYSNLFYRGPLVLDGRGPQGTAAKVEWMISQLKQARIAEKEREMAIQERAARRLAAIVEFSDDAIVSKDLNGTITSWNRGAETLFGYSAEEMVGQPVMKLIPPERHDEEPGILERIRRGEHIDHYETIRQRKDGSLVEISLSVSPIKDSSGKVVGASKIARDITDRKEAERALRAAKDDLARANEQLEERVRERTAALEIAQAARLRNIEEQKKLEEQLRHAQKMESIGTLAGGIAHDFNNILNIIKGYTSILPHNSTQSADAVRVIDDTIDRGASLVKQLLTLARKSEARLMSTNINKVVGDLSNLLQQTLPKTVDVSLHLDADLPPIMADSGQIMQALLNLCVNARDAMPDGGKLTLKTATVDRNQIQAQFSEAEERDHVRIDVSDTGIGMDMAVRNRIFEPFYTTKPHGQGTGLGLAIVYGIVKSHHGIIDVATETGAGTTFSLYLPVVESEANAASANSIVRHLTTVKSANSRGAILIAEDEPNMLSLLQRSLSRIGYQVITAVDGQEVIDLYHRYKQEIQVVLLDMGLPKIQGWDVILQLRRDDPNLSIAVTSGYIDPSLKMKMDRAAIDAVIYKPYSIGQIIEILQNVIKRSRTGFKSQVDAAVLT